jgi:hypothetical protein
MKANTTCRRLFTWSARFACAAGALAFANSGFAQPNNSDSAKKAKANVHPNADHKRCYVMLSSSPFPQPCDRVGAVPTTASPMVIIGEAPTMAHRTTK